MIIHEMKKSLLIVIFLCIHYTQSISLNGKWNGYILSSGTSFAAKVPGGIYTDLEKAGIIPMNLKGFNDVNNRWVANESIAYVTEININDDFLNAPHIILIFHGLDTFATIYVNNIEVGKTSNMFKRYSFDINNILKNGNNEIKVVFEPSVKVAKTLYNIQKDKYIVPPECVPKEYKGECHVNFIRKMQASFGWDWGAAFPSMGIWKNVELQSVENVLVSEITTDILKKNNLWEIDVTVFFETFGEKNTVINKLTHIICSLENQYSNNSIIPNLTVTNNEANASVKLSIPTDKIELWWPNGYGKQKLYTLNVKVKSETDVTEQKLKIGFRTVELVQDPLKKGLSFYFKINDVPIFAKGSNWIPSNTLPENLSKKETLHHLLKSSKDTHMNMMRVWGGGVYESDLFYSIADEYGIMIWQDFMFACNMYPTTTSFLDNVKSEVIQNVRRLKHHPSIVLWAGNNENEAALYGNWYGTGTKQIYKDDYVKLYVDTIKNEVIKIDSTRPFVISSPSNGIYSEETNYTNSNPYSNFYGDVHYYSYLKNSWDVNQYPVTRFASEYGFQALPSIWTLLPVIENSTDLKLKSAFMEHRQHLAQGNNYMKLLISKNLAIPKNDNFVVELMNFIYLSQIMQAVSVKIETELYRQMKSSFNDAYEGMTMGALYWQLNDVWQAPSWSSIDFDGRWKMLHYFVKDFFAPVIVTSRLTEADELLIYVVSDLLENLININVNIVVYEWETSKSIYTRKIENLTIEPNESKLIANFWIDKFLVDAGCGDLGTAKKNCMIELILNDASGLRIAPTNYVYPHFLKQVSLPKDSVAINVQPQVDRIASSNQTDFTIEVTSEKIALFVWLEVGKITGQFSENGFHILNGNKTVVFRASQVTTVEDITKNLVVTTLSRIYDSNLRALDAQTVIAELDKFNQS